MPGHFSDFLFQFRQFAVVGDFNLPHIDWCRVTALPGASAAHHLFLEMLADGFITQHVTFATRRSQGLRHCENVLDLFLTQDGIEPDVSDEPPLGNRDHSVLMVNYPILRRASLSSPLPPSCSTYNFAGADYEALNKAFALTDWTALQDLPIHDCWLAFKAILFSALEKYVPKFGGSTSSVTKPWISGRVKRLLRKKERLWKKLRSALASGCSDRILSARASYKSALADSRHEIFRAKRSADARKLRVAKSNPRSFFKFVNKRLKPAAAKPSLRLPDGSIPSFQQAANLFNASFSAKFTTGLASLEGLPVYNNTLMPDYIPSCRDVRSVLKGLRASSSPGPDLLPNRLLKLCANTLSAPLALIFRRSLEDGALPSDWLIAHVTPVYKRSGKKVDVRCYRPISLTSAVCKVFEICVKQAVVHHVSSLLHPAQHGFLKGRSTTSNLLTTLYSWLSSLDDGYPTDVIYLDISKAFDSVPHNRLIAKLRCFGISPSLVAWVEAYLTDRTQRVCVGGCLSDTLPVLSGVPQGSVLGPLLFLLYLNDLPSCVLSRLALYADDLKLHRTITAFHDVKLLQLDLDQLGAWARTNSLSFNSAKSYHLRIMSSTRDVGRLSPYFLDGSRLERVTEQKDLAILVTSNLDFSKHCDAVTTRANSILGAIRRNFSFLDCNTLTVLYNSFVRPVLEYGSTVWCPYRVKNVASVDRVFYRATKVATRLRHLPRAKRVEILQWTSPCVRRNYLDLSLLYTILACPTQDFFLSSTSTSTRGHTRKLFVRQARLDSMKYGFFTRVVPMWNSLPEDSVSSSSIALFQCRLKQHLCI